MIIFYLKSTGDIIGTVNGRVHDENQIKNVMIKPSNIDESEIGKYVVPFKTIFKEAEEPITELRVVNKKTMLVKEVVVGKQKVKRGAGMTPDVPFADLILDFESGKKEIYDYQVRLKNGIVARFTKKKT